MADALDAIEAAIREVSKIRQSVMRKKSKQVPSADEIDQLKSVAFAWFRSHQPVVGVHPSKLDLSYVDLAYRTIMDSTGRHAARSTYLNALQKAKGALVKTRGFIATNFHAAPAVTTNATNAAPPNFAPLAADAKMQMILQRRWDEVQRCLASESNLAATVMMGGLLESLLLARINSSPDKAAVFKAKTVPRNKAGKALTLPEWKLIHMVDVAHEFAWITKSAKSVGNVLRDFRNYIHPHKEYTDAVQILDEDASMFWEVTKSIARHVLASVGKSP